MILRICLFIMLNVLLLESRAVKKVSDEERNPEYWMKIGTERILNKLNEIPVKSVAKNIILVIGDGMGISTLTSTRIYKNQQLVSSILPDQNLIFENFPNVGLSKTYSVDRYVADSAATATAILTGVKTNSGVVGLSSKIRFKECNSSLLAESELTTIAEMFYKKGKSVGFVTTSSIVDATPAAIYAFSPSRNWRDNVPRKCPMNDIALQFLQKSKKFQVVMGGGRRSFIPKDEKDIEHPFPYGYRKDKRNLIDEWKQEMAGIYKEKAQFIWNSTQLQNIDSKSIKYLFGLFDSDDIKYKDKGNGDPTLEEMSQKALEILSTNENGYFLLIEGAKIDKSHHANKAWRAILETLELEKAVNAALKMSNPSDTLIIVTADHSHTLTLGSYLKRDNDIIGMNKGFSGDAKDKKGHTSLLYANGPGYKFPRENITSETQFTPDKLFNSGVPLDKGTHGGEEVSVYAKGPWAHLLKDIYEQSYIGHVMMYASCNGKYSDRDGCFGSNAVIHYPMIITFAFSFLYSRLIAL